MTGMKRPETKAEWHMRVFGVPMPSKSRKVTDWMRAIHIGDRVYDVADERHIGEVTKIANSTATVKWPNGWISELFVGDLKKEGT